MTLSENETLISQYHFKPGKRGMPIEGNLVVLTNKRLVVSKENMEESYHLSKITGVKVQQLRGGLVRNVGRALCHRSYNVQGNAIYIKHFDDRLEISNSGPLPAQVNVENIRTERFSRNPRIARALEDMGFVRQLNEGVSRIYKSMEKSMLSTPEYVEKNGNIFLTLRNKISTHTKTIPDSIIKMVHENWSG